MNLKNYVRANWSPDTDLHLRVARECDGCVRDLTISRHNKWEVVGYAPKGKKPLIRADLRLSGAASIKEGTILQGSTKILRGINEYMLDFKPVAADYVPPKTPAKVKFKPGEVVPIKHLPVEPSSVQA